MNDWFYTFNWKLRQTTIRLSFYAFICSCIFYLASNLCICICPVCPVAGTTAICYEQQNLGEVTLTWLLGGQERRKRSRNYWRPPTSSCDYVSQTSVPQTHTTFRSILIGSLFLKETWAPLKTFIILYPLLPSTGTAFSGRHPGSWLIARIKKWGVLKHGGSP